MSIQCPGCGTDLEPAATSCPTCLRPRSRQEIFSGYSQARDEESERKGKPLRILRNILALGLLAAGGVVLVKREWSTPSHLMKAVDSIAQTTGRYRQGSAEANPDPTPVPSPPALPAAAPESTPATKSSASGTPTKQDAAQEKPREPEETPQWTVSGKVFWFLNLKPVGHATLIFKDKNSGNSVRSLSAPNGDYKADLPPLEEGGYEVTVYVKSKSRLFIEDTVGPSVRQYSQERRKEEADDHLRQGGVLHVPLLLPAGVMNLRYDVALLP